MRSRAAREGDHRRIRALRLYRETIFRSGENTQFSIHGRQDASPTVEDLDNLDAGVDLAQKIAN